MSKYSVGQEVEVFEPDFDTPGFPMVWRRGTVDRIEKVGKDNLDQVFVRSTVAGHEHPVWSPQVIGKRGGNRNIRPVETS